MARRLFQSWLDWIWKIAAKKGALRVFLAVSFTEAIFFPIPPDIFLIPMALARREQAFRLAWLCLIASLAGGIVGYLLGYYFMEVLGFPILTFYGLEQKYLLIQTWYEKYSAWAVGIAGLTPIPYKLCTLTAGAFKINFFIFIVASALSRGVRFFAIAGVIHLFGDRAVYFLEKRFDWILLATVLLVIAGFVFLKLI